MQVEGSYTFLAPRQRVWDALMEPQTLRHCLPGCDELQPQGNGRYRVVMRVGVAAVKGTFQGTVEVKAPQAFERYSLALDARSAIGFARGEGRFELQEQGEQTILSYTGEVHLGGTIAAVGQRLVGSAARMVIDQFFGCVARRLTDTGSSTESS